MVNHNLSHWVWGQGAPNTEKTSIRWQESPPQGQAPWGHFVSCCESCPMPLGTQRSPQ